MGIDTVIPLGMIFSELMTNVVKYAFPEGKSGTVRIELTTEEDSVYTLEVADDGVGLPDDYENRKEDSIGHLLVSALAKQIDGEFSVERVEGETRFSVRFAAVEEE
jgi:two-component sensor histidine kinase